MPGWPPVEVGGLANQQVRALGQPYQRVALPCVGGVGEPPAVVLDPEPERLHWMVHVIGDDEERPDLEGTGREIVEGEARLDGRRALAAEARDPFRGPRGPYTGMGGRGPPGAHCRATK